MDKQAENKILCDQFGKQILPLMSNKFQQNVNER